MPSIVTHGMNKTMLFMTDSNAAAKSSSRRFLGAFNYVGSIGPLVHVANPPSVGTYRQAHLLHLHQP